MGEQFLPSLMTTGVGSVPLTDAEQGVSFVLDAGLSIPFWPQLPKRSFLEQMVPQYSESAPCVRIDQEQERITYDLGDKYDQLERFYEAFLSEQLDGFALSETFAAGFAAFERVIEGKTFPIVKGQVTGPITFCMGISDADRNPLYNDPELRDAAVKLLTRNAQWQIERLRRFSDQSVLVFVDEPVLAAYGSSAYVGVSEQDVCRMEGEIFEAIRDAGAISGIHVCGNSDWGVVLRSGVQVINFDSYQYGTTIGLYADDVRELFDRGGSIAWGIVPTTDAIAGESVDSLVKRFEECLGGLTNKGFSRELLCERALLTPSCGTGPMSIDNSRRVFDLLRGLRQQLIG